MRGRGGFHARRRGPRPAAGTWAGQVALPPTEIDAGLLLRVLCHEFRTPVSALTSLTRALADEARPLTGEDRRAVTALVREQAAHLQGLLRAATASGGALALAGRPEPVAALAHVLPPVVALVPAHRARLRVTLGAAGCPVPVRRTRQVLTNLVENALRHGPAGGAVEIRAALRGRGLSIRVADEGRLTGALVEALRRPAPAVGAHGLGLWIVRHLVACDGGTLRAHRLLGGGVALEVLLPRVGRPGATPPRPG
ncbi:sensor histidine kinase [Micromonospora sp. DT233]|uniref:sensor histidine kinase n=1 Tax=Micromonospora sp. DT233 TaxID=3393432 RepID=UPI003CF07B40